MMINVFKADWFLAPQLDYLLFLQNFRILTNGIFDSFFLFITKLGEWSVTIPLLASYYWSINTRGGTYILLTSVFGGVTNQLFKMTECIYRPWILDSDIKPVKDAIEGASGYSFPSGHTDKAITIWGGLAVVNWKNIILRLFFVLIFFLIAFSRNYLGVHTPQDVIVSALIGIFLLLGVKKLILWVEEKENRDILVLILSYTFVLSVLFFVQFKSYPIDYLNGKILVNPDEFKPSVFLSCGYAIGILTGLFLNRRFIRFDANFGKVWSKILRCFIGLFILFLFINYVSQVLIAIFGSSIGLFICYFFVGIFITAIYPFIVATASSQKRLSE